MSQISDGPNTIDNYPLPSSPDEMPYSGIRTFLRRPISRSYEGVDYVVLGIPFDILTSGRSGARFGPSALREASLNLSCGTVWPWGINPFDTLNIIDAGDVPFHRGQSADMLDNAYRMANAIVENGAGTIMIGGDHCVAYPMLKAHAQYHGPLALIHIDAHCDTLKSEFLDHGTFAYHAIKDGLIDPAASIQIGIRTHYAKNSSIRILYRDWLHEQDRAVIVSAIQDAVGDRKAYLTIDIDGFDPSYAPGTGTPVVDGLAPFDVISFIRQSIDINIVGMDLVEVSPPYDPTGSTALLGATLIQEFICSRAVRKSRAAVMEG